MFDADRFDELIAGESDGFRFLARTYVGEALFFDALVGEELRARPGVREVAEVGAGIGLLSMLLAARGLAVTAYEPQSAGFGEMGRIRGFVRGAWRGSPPEVEWVDGRAGDTAAAPARRFDHAVCVNVLEHVPDTAGFLRTLAGLTRPGGHCRAIFPNYAFPYEPHFNIPTLWSKDLTHRVWRRRIGASTLPDPAGMWADLSWPTVRGVGRIAAREGIEVSFSRDACAAYVGRLRNDAHFAERKGRLMSSLARPVAGALGAVVPVWPMPVLPIVDMRIASAHR